LISVKRLGHVTLTTPDMDRQIAYFTDVVGLTVIERGKDRAFLACKLGLEAVALEPGPGNAMSRLAFQVDPDSDLNDVARALTADGVKCERRSGISPGIADAVVFTDPKGSLVEIFSGYKFAKDDGRTAGVMPLKLGHVAYRVDDVQKTVKFYCDVLGFRVSDCSNCRASVCGLRLARPPTLTARAAAAWARYAAWNRCRWPYCA